MRPGLFLLLLSVPSFPGFAMTSLSKKVCIVVGLGKGGIGEHVAKRFASEDYNIAMIARSSLQHLEQQIPNSKGYQCDAGNPEEVSRTVEAIRKDFGDSIHALMYNAGSGVFKPFEQTTYEEFDIAFRTGPGGIFLWTKACLPYMPAGSAIGLTGATVSALLIPSWPLSTQPTDFKRSSQSAGQLARYAVYSCFC
jgi:NAD(P)-dependent dehydrogenase (short-subunit alcohol dehydrogenase family)